MVCFVLRHSIVTKMLAQENGTVNVKSDTACHGYSNKICLQKG